MYVAQSHAKRVQMAALACIMALLAFAFSLAGCIREPCVKKNLSALKLQLILKKAADIDSVLTNERLNVKIWNPQTATWQSIAINSTGDFYVLPVDKRNEATLYVFGKFINNSLEWGDTLAIQYSPQLAFLSEACGFDYFLNIESHKARFQNFDSLRIVHTFIDTSRHAHVKLYTH